MLLLVVMRRGCFVTSYVRVRYFPSAPSALHAVHVVHLPSQCAEHSGKNFFFYRRREDGNSRPDFFLFLMILNDIEVEELEMESYFIIRQPIVRSTTPPSPTPLLCLLKVNVKHPLKNIPVRCSRWSGNCTRNVSIYFLPGCREVQTRVICTSSYLRNKWKSMRNYALEVLPPPVPLPTSTASRSSCRDWERAQKLWTDVEGLARVVPSSPAAAKVLGRRAISVALSLLVSRSKPAPCVSTPSRVLSL